MRAFGLVALLIALGAGVYLYTRSTSSGPGGTAPAERIDTTAIRQRLLTLGQAERQYLATHSSYATLDQLQEEGLLVGGTEERGYTLSAVTTGAERFTITARPTDAGKAGWPTLEVTERMEVVER